MYINDKHNILYHKNIQTKPKSRDKKKQKTKPKNKKKQKTKKAGIQEVNKIQLSQFTVGFGRPIYTSYADFLTCTT
jgi:hypothetical protein